MINTTFNSAPTYDALLIRYLARLLPALTEYLGKGQEPERAITPELAPEPFPTPTSSRTELDQLSSKIVQESLQVLAKLDGEFMMQELASASRARDYIDHLEAHAIRESGCVERFL